VLQWQYAPVRNATAAVWSALVLAAPFPEAVSVRWVSANQTGAARRGPQRSEDTRRQAGEAGP
jgi:hypothetical protein